VVVKDGMNVWEIFSKWQRAGTGQEAVEFGFGSAQALLA